MDPGGSAAGDAAPPEEGAAAAQRGAGTGGDWLTELAGLGDEALLDAVRETEAVGRRVDALRAALAAEAAHRSRRELGGQGLARRLGCRTGVELIQRLTGAAGASVNRRTRLGLATRPVTGQTGQPGLATFPQVAAALTAGTLGVDAATALVDTLRPTLPVAGRTDVHTAETAILTDAVAPDPTAPPAADADTVRLQAQVWAAILDPDGPEPTETDIQRRGMWLLAPRHGLIPVRGNLLPDVAAALTTYAHACTNPRTPDLPGPTTDAETAGSDAGCSEPQDLPAHLLDTRSKAHQMHDVLAAIIHTAARVADAPSLAGNVPTLVITVRAEDLATGTEAGSTLGSVSLPRPVLGTVPGAAFADDCATPVGMSAARHVGCAGAVQAIALDATGRITGIGSPQRCFTGTQRRAITVRDGGCIIPGCHVPAAWCETHHVTPHATDPTGTTTDNGVLLCWYHHRTIDTSGWQIRMVRGLPQIRAPRWLDPDGAWRPARGSPHAALRAITAQRDALVGDRDPAAPDD